jgi:aflatoxin B1 aldehyde reductase
MYNNELFLGTHDEWGRIANEENVTRSEFAFRWMCHHSSLKAERGDGITIGGRLAQLGGYSKYYRGPLSEQAVKKIQELWENLQPHVKYLHNLQAMR